VPGRWRKLHDKLQILYFSPNLLLGQIKEDDMTGHSARIGNLRMLQNIHQNTLKKQMEAHGVNRKIILKFILRKVWTSGRLLWTQ
jgi:hypothetical protein